MLRAKNKAILRIGVVGTGRIAKRFMPEARGVSGIDVQAVYNPNFKSAKEFAEKYEVDATKTIDEFFSRVDAIYIASPHETHYNYIKMALQRGKHVLCEKPMALNADDCREMIAVAKETAAHGAGAAPERPKPVKSEKKPGRNDRCPCGSGKRYKECCGANPNLLK